MSFYRKILAVPLALVLLLLFQNCDQGFDSQAVNASLNSENNSPTITDNNTGNSTDDSSNSNTGNDNSNTGNTGNNNNGGNNNNNNGGNNNSGNNNTGNTGPMFSCLSDNMLQLALNQSLIRFNQGLKGGAHTWTFHYAEVALAVHAACGDTRADARLLQQLRNVLIPGNGPTAQGGYADQHQVGILTAFTIAEKIPRIWSQFSAAEKNKIDLIFEAALVSNSFVSADANPFVLAKVQQHSMDGGTNFNRGWNPNHRAGTIGSVIIATAHLGLTRAKNLLLNHNHQDFINRLSQAGLNNLANTYNASNVPSNNQIETTLQTPFNYYGIPHDNVLDIFIHLANYTYGRTVFCGLNNGAGITRNGVTGGMISRNCNLLPNKGQMGMLTEFDSQDANGKRSSATYAFDGLRPVNTIQVALIANNVWQDNATTQNLVAKMKVGIEDLYFKIDPQVGGYINYSKGKASTSTTFSGDKYGHNLVYEVITGIGMNP